MAKITLKKTESVSSVNKDGSLAVNLKQSTKPIHFLDIKSTVNQMEVFETERENCNKYRLILNIKPFCTNVLFNPLTEIIKGEGSDNPIIATDNTTLNISGNIYGKSAQVNRIDMIRNTEYSRAEIGYEYHPGYDMFNNHTLRNQSFKLVNILGSNSVHKGVFNTIRDYMRYADGTIVKHGKRVSVSEVEENKDTHLYQHEDISSITETINNNLVEENGWWGFVNKSSIDNKYYDGKKTWNSIGIEKVINSKKNCEFIDMYPDRTLFSFSPKYNKYKHKPEYNWNICITYPYKNNKLHSLVSSISNGEVIINALKVYSVIKTVSKNGNDILLFKTYTKHGLNKGNYINIYFNNKSSCKSYIVSNVGDISQNDKDYYFYIEDLRLLTELKINYEDADDAEINEQLQVIDFRINKVVSGVESQYYIRMHRKLPNFRYKRMELTEEVADNNEKLEKYLYDGKNASRDGKKLMNFNNEQYKLAFSKTIYNDDITQITFTDGIEVEKLKDNLGRPLTNIYITIIKNNKGYKEWYNNDLPITKYTEFSHCFGKVNTGFEMLYGGYDDSGKYSDIREINNLGINQSTPLEADGEEVLFDNDVFYGDIVEFNPIDCNEVVLSDACFRFNTAQREWKKNDKSWLSDFIYDEIDLDDYDQGDFNVTENVVVDSYNGLNTTERPEGYFYKAHYPIMIKELGNINQSSHLAISVLKSKCVVINEHVYVQITTKLKSSLSTNDIVYFFDQINDKWYKTRVCYVINSTNFAVSPFNITDENGEQMFKKIDGIPFTPQLDLMSILNNTNKNNLCVLKHNGNIPSYAYRISGQNKFLWRNILRAGDVDANNIPEYVFANGYFYIVSTINFYLKRQDPENKMGLYCSETFPNDVYGNIQKESNYEYKDENTIEC